MVHFSTCASVLHRAETLSNIEALQGLLRTIWERTHAVPGASDYPLKMTVAVFQSCANVVTGHRVRGLLWDGVVDGYDGKVERLIATTAVRGNANFDKTQRVEDDTVESRPFW